MEDFTVKIINFIVCDDIRREIGGKNTLVGVYDELNLNVHKGVNLTWPVVIRLGFYCNILKEEENIECNKFEFIAINENQQIAQIGGTIDFTKEGRFANLSLLINAFSILKPGKIEFKIKFYKDNELIEELIPHDFYIKLTQLK